MPKNKLKSLDLQAKLLDYLQVAKLLSCSPRHVRRLADAGKMPFPIKLGTLSRFDRESIESWISAGCPAVRTVTRKAVRP